MAMAFTHVNENKGLARVQNISGKEVYVLSEPVQEYNVVEIFTTALTTTLTGRQTIDSQMKEVISRGLKKQLQFDAVMTDDGKRVMLLKFKN